MNLQLAGKTALVTGASKGIGFAIAKCFAAEGATPVLVSRDAAALKKAADAIHEATGIAARTVSMDLAAPGSHEALYAQAGAVDYLVNNAGAIPGGDLSAVDDARWREAWELKLYGSIGLVRKYLPQMQARQAGVIVNVIGMAGVANRANYICGSTANAALIAFTNAVGAASPKHGVRVFGVNPSPTLTERTEKRFASLEERKKMEAALPFGRMARAEEVANLVVFGCSPLAGYLSGTVVNLDGGQLYS